MITAEIIAIGSELLLGGRSETNSVFLSKLLAAQGIEVRFKTVVGDDIPMIRAALSTAARRAKIVLVTGGLGPTVDDLTREAVCQTMGRSLRRHAKAWKAMQSRFRQRGRSITRNQQRQAYLPVGADYLENLVGTAPGFSLKWKGCRFFCLPGVTHEAEHLFHHGVLPLLIKEGLGAAPIHSRVIHTFGLIEGEVDERISGVVQPADPIRLGLLASPLGVSVSLIFIPQVKTKVTLSVRNDRSVNENFKNIKLKLENYMESISGILEPNVFAYDDDRMETVVARNLSATGMTLSLAESCTGGLIGHRLTQVPGSSAFLDRGVVCYSNRSKMDLLGVSAYVLRKYGAVSARVARDMAEGIRKRSDTHLGLSVTGIAGPNGGTPQKPVGLVYVGLSTPDATYTKEYRFHGSRDVVKLRSSQGALDLLRRYIFGLPVSD